MREPGEIVAALPRPGPVLKVILGLIAALAVVSAIVVNWAPGGERGAELFRLFAFEPQDVALEDYDPHPGIKAPVAV